MQYALDCFTTVITTLVCFFMLFKKYEIKKDHLILRISSVVLILLIKCFAILLGIPPLNLLTSCLLCVSVVWVTYKCSVKTTIIYSLLLVMIAFVSDVLGIIIVSGFYDNTITETMGTTDLVWHHHIWNWIFQIVLSRITALFIKQNHNIRTRWYEMTFYIFLLSFEVSIFIAISYAVQDYMSGQFLILVMSGFMILDICFIFILQKISSLRDTEQRLRLMEQQETLQLQMYRELNKKYKKAREIAHDINRHISSLESLISYEHYKQAEQYFFDLTKATERLNPIIKNQNSILAIILNTVSERCEKENIELKLNVEDFSLDFISDIDMTTIFSNLFDNAIEACMELSRTQRYINFVLKKQIGLIVVNITNSCEVKSDNGSILNHSTKANHSGIGLLNVRKAVNKYNGVFSAQYEENSFCATATFSENR